MNFQSYLNYFKEIVDNPNPPAPYNDPAYIEYTKLNWSRMNRWLKTAVIDKTLQNVIKELDQPQSWIVITEPWCGDAAHSVPFIEMISKLNPLIIVEYELRDSPPFRIEQYLANGCKSIPVLVVRDENGDDMFKWGPRPAEAQELHRTMTDKKASHEETKVAIQNWYNKDKGQSIQNELRSLLEKIRNIKIPMAVAAGAGLLTTKTTVYF